MEKKDLILNFPSNKDAKRFVKYLNDLEKVGQLNFKINIRWSW